MSAAVAKTDCFVVNNGQAQYWLLWIISYTTIICICISLTQIRLQKVKKFYGNQLKQSVIHKSDSGFQILLASAVTTRKVTALRGITL